MNLPTTCEVCSINTPSHYLIVSQPAVPSQRCACCSSCFDAFKRTSGKYPGMTVKEVTAQQYYEFTTSDFLNN